MATLLNVDLLAPPGTAGLGLPGGTFDAGLPSCDRDLGSAAGAPPGGFSAVGFGGGMGFGGAAPLSVTGAGHVIPSAFRSMQRSLGAFPSSAGRGVNNDAAGIALSLSDQFADDNVTVGRGATGSVRVVYSRRLGRRVALKTIAELTEDKVTSASVEIAFARRAIATARAQTGLADADEITAEADAASIAAAPVFANIAAVFSVTRDTAERETTIVMEALTGQSLASWYSDFQCMPGVAPEVAAGTDPADADLPPPPCAPSAADESVDEGDGVPSSSSSRATATPGIGGEAVPEEHMELARSWSSSADSPVSPAASHSPSPHTHQADVADAATVGVPFGPSAHADPLGGIEHDGQCATARDADGWSGSETSSPAEATHGRRASTCDTEGDADGWSASDVSLGVPREPVCHPALIDRRHSPEAALARVATDVLLGLRTLHDELHTLHRDVKPENIVFAGDGRAKLVDFGVAHLFRGACGSATSQRGSLAFMSPERLRGEPHGPNSDVWALAVTLLTVALGGLHPFLGHQDLLQRVHDAERHDELDAPCPCPPARTQRLPAERFWVLAEVLRHTGGPQECREATQGAVSLALRCISAFRPSSLFEDFITCALDTDPQRRPAPDTLLQRHPWLRPSG